MKERPILFQGAMVRALLAGTKTQTRREVKWRDVSPGLNLGFTGLQAVNQDARGWVLTSMGGSCWQERCAPTPCPYGQPGGRLWVRETWAHGIHAMAALRDEDGPFVYAATDSIQGRLGDRWRPSIHMPRYVSRITLEITAVRVERLQAISETDATAEGVTADKPHTWWQGYREHNGDLMHQQVTGDTPPDWMVEPHRMKRMKHLERSARDWYQALWNSINGAGSWEANPWVWVVEFRRVQP
jgi:hypothetical protein